MWTKLSATVAFAFVLTLSVVGTGLAVPNGSHGINVSMLRAPQALLMGRLVEDMRGVPFGRVRSVDVDRDGKAKVVNIEVGAVRNRGTQIVAVDAHQIVYYPQKAELVASIDPPPVAAPRFDRNAPERASTKRPAPQPTIFRN
jgi:hypothetical protein